MALDGPKDANGGENEGTFRRRFGTRPERLATNYSFPGPVSKVNSTANLQAILAPSTLGALCSRNPRVALGCYPDLTFYVK
jgi:hypothetical protein